MKLLARTLFALATAAAIPASAGTISLVRQIDANSLSASFSAPYWILDWSAGLPQQLQVAEGDTLDLTLTFLPGQALQLVYPGTIALAMRGKAPQELFALQDAQADLLGLIGPASASRTTDGTWSYATLGGFWDGFVLDDPFDLASTISITGIRVQSIVKDYFTPGIQDVGNMQMYSELYAYFDALEYSVIAANTPNSIPEPHSMWLLLPGILALSTARRRFRSQLGPAHGSAA